ncbi:EamA family transporter [Snodgrassella alvi]|uniref:EamA family transporter n=1 Tax=Snodgrassella alvi TaxID=1196083 RepID=UPI00352D3867
MDSNIQIAIKALGYLSAAQVQVTELAEPIFAMLMGWLILSELPDYAFFLGALLIITGIMLINNVLGLLETYFFKRTKISKR